MPDARSSTGGLDHHRRAALHVAPGGVHRRKEHRQIGPMREIHRGWHGDDQEVRFAQRRRIGGALQLASRGELLGADFAGDIFAFAQAGDLALIAVEADRRTHGAEGDRKRQADVAEPDDGHGHL
jgi:hypothetical protein